MGGSKRKCTNDFIDFQVLGRLKRAGVLWRCAIFAIFWVIWLEINGPFFFEEESWDVDFLQDKVRHLASFLCVRESFVQRNSSLFYCSRLGVSL